MRNGIASASVMGLVAAVSAANLAHAQDYKLGYITDLSGPMVSTFAPVHDSFKLYFDTINAKGGVNGKKVSVVVRDDQLNATRAASLFRELVEAEGVNSVWSMSLSSTLAGVYALGERNQVPAISSVSAVDETLPPNAKPFAYSTGLNYRMSGAVAGRLAKSIAPEKGLLVCVTIESAGGKAGCESTEASAKAEGYTAESVYFPARTPDFSAIGQKIAATNPTVVLTILPAGFAQNALVATRAAGYAKAFLMLNVALDEHAVVEAMKSVENKGTTYLYGRYALPSDDTKETKEMVAALTKAGINPSAISGNTVVGWVHAKTAEAALTKCGSPCPGTKMNETLMNLTVDLGGLMGGPIKFTPDDHQGDAWWKLYKYDPASKKFLSAGNWEKSSSRM